MQNTYRVHEQDTSITTECRGETSLNRDTVNRAIRAFYFILKQLTMSINYEETPELLVGKTVYILHNNYHYEVEKFHYYVVKSAFKSDSNLTPLILELEGIKRPFYCKSIHFEVLPFSKGDRVEFTYTPSTSGVYGIVTKPGSITTEMDYYQKEELIKKGYFANNNIIKLSEVTDFKVGDKIVLKNAYLLKIHNNISYGIITNITNNKCNVRWYNKSDKAIHQNWNYNKDQLKFYVEIPVDEYKVGTEVILKDEIRMSTLKSQYDIVFGVISEMNADLTVEVEWYNDKRQFQLSLYYSIAQLKIFNNSKTDKDGTESNKTGNPYKVQRSTATISNGDRRAGAAISGRRSKTAIGFGHLSNQAVNSN